MNRATLHTLATRCETATGPDRELDAEIALAMTVGAVGVERGPLDRLGSEFLFAFAPRRSWAESWVHVPKYSASLDAAMSLVPEGWFGALDPIFFIDGERVIYEGFCIKPMWEKYTPVDSWMERILCRAHTPALALCAASLRAMAEHPESSHGA